MSQRISFACALLTLLITGVAAESTRMCFNGVKDYPLDRSPQAMAVRPSSVLHYVCFDTDLSPMLTTAVSNLLVNYTSVYFSSLDAQSAVIASIMLNSTTPIDNFISALSSPPPPPPPTTTGSSVPSSSSTSLSGWSVVVMCLVAGLMF